MIIKCIGYGSWGCRPGRKLNLPDDRASTLIRDGVAVAIGVGKPTAAVNAIVIPDEPDDDAEIERLLDQAIADANG